MKLDTFRRLDSHDRRIRQLERTEPEAGGGPGTHFHTLDDLQGVIVPPPIPSGYVLTYDAGSDIWDARPPAGGDHPDSDHSTFALVDHDTAHDDRFSLLAHTHAAHADSDHDDRFALIAAGVPAGGTAGQVLTKDTGTDFDTSWQTGAAHADSDHDDRFSQLGHTHTAPVEMGYAEVTSNVSVTATTSATSHLVVALGAVTYTAVPHEFEWFSPHVSTASTAGAQVQLGLYDGSASVPLGRVTVRNPTAAANGWPAFGKIRLTPSAGSHTYQVRAYASVTGGTVFAGAGGGDVPTPAYLKVTRL